MNVNLGATTTNPPIFYINFQKGGPVPDATLCTNPPSPPAIYDYCRIYSKYRNIMVVKYINNVASASFTSAGALLPRAK